MSAIILLAPYATLRVGFERALRVQAMAILGATLLLLLWGLVQRMRRSGAGWRAAMESLLADVPRPLQLGVALYAAATLLGALVGWLSGHPASRVVAQVLSMGLLPLGAVAGFCFVGTAGSPTQLARPRRPPLFLFAPTLVLGAAVAAAAHLLHAGLRLAHGMPAGRLYFANSVSIAGASLLALLLALALAHARGWRVQIAWVAAALVLAVYMMGSGIRGLILLTPVAVLLFLATATPKRRWWRGAALLVLLLGALLGAQEALWRWDTAERPSLIPGRGTAHLFEKSKEAKRGEPSRILPPGLTLEKAPWRGGQFRRSLVWPARPGGEVIRVPKTLPIERPGLVRMVAHLGSENLPLSSEASGCVSLWWLDDARAKLGELTACAPASRGWRQEVASGVVPGGTTQARVVFYSLGAEPPAIAGSGEPQDKLVREAPPGRWRLQHLHLERLGDAEKGRALEQLAFVTERARSLLHPLDSGSRAMRSSATFRLEESRALLAAYAAASPLRWLTGHGLGASYSLEGAELARPEGTRLESTRIEISQPSHRLDAGDLHYIHNFYLFLLFKLGLLGALAVLVALGSWLSWLFTSTRRVLPGRRRALLAALLAAWTGYCAWSVVSPEILNFRLAPLWGLTLALAAQLAREPEPASAG